MFSWSNAIVKEVKEGGKYFLTELYYERVDDYNVNITGHSIEDGPFESLEEMASFANCGRAINEALLQGHYYKYDEIDSYTDIDYTKEEVEMIKESFKKNS